MRRHVVSAQANIGAADVKARSDGRSQNYMPPEAAHAIEQAQKDEQTVVKS
ncbi:MAG: hypothetical protein ACK4TK_00175 [Thiobacillaceae bacterium]